MNLPSLSRPLVLAALAPGSLITIGCASELSTAISAARDEFNPAPVVPVASQEPPRLIVDEPHPGQLAMGRLVIRYRTENLRIVPVYGPDALNVSPRIGHLHITVDDASWHWLDASGEPIVLNGFHPGPHKVLIELADPTHKVLDSATVLFEIPTLATRHK